jgi:hypothetical protein
MMLKRQFSSQNINIDPEKHVATTPLWKNSPSPPNSCQIISI